MKVLNPGERSVLVQYVQLALNRAGYDIRKDGILGENTCRALRQFLRKKGGEEFNCKIDDVVWGKLFPYLKGYTMHEIKSGDTLWGIAANYDTSVSAIMTANPTVNPLALRTGSILAIPFSFSLVAEDVAYTSYLNDWILEGLTVRYPFLVQGNIGKSAMGKEIPYLRIGTGEREVFYSGAYHANEWITTPVLLKFAEEYAHAFAAGRMLYTVQAAWLFYGFSLYLVPMVNPDGVDLVNGVLEEGASLEEAERIAADYPKIPFPDGWKANIEGIDLNLQFPAGWENARNIKFAMGFTTPAPRDYVGEAPLVAPESRSVYEFTRAHNFSLILAYHAQGEVIYWRYLDYEPADSRRIAEYFGEVSGYRVEETPSTSGYAGFKDWFIQEYNRPGYTIEVGMGVSPLPMSQFAGIYEDNRLILEGGMTELVR